MQQLDSIGLTLPWPVSTLGHGGTQRFDFLRMMLQSTTSTFENACTVATQGVGMTIE